jgi:acetyl esterase
MWVARLSECEQMPAIAAKSSATSATYAIDVEDVEYLRHGETPLLARLFKPKGAGPFPVVVDLHGGAWCTGDRLNDTVLNEALARTGILVAALDFRMPPAASYPGSLADINYAVRWLKANAGRWNARADRIGIIGISSGGHQGMLGAMRPADPRYAAIELSGASVDARVNCVVMLWPVIDPLGRYRTAKAAVAKGGDYPEQFKRVLPSHDKFWGSEAAMAEGAPVNALEKGEVVELPPALLVQGTADHVHPHDQREAFVAAYRKRGGEIDVALYEGEESGFVMRDAKNPANARAALERVIGFLHEKLA